MRHIALALVLSVAACSATDPPARCTPGVQIPCACPGGSLGAQACAASGDGYGTCMCAADAGGVDAAVVDVPRADVVDAAPRDVPLRPADPRCADNITRRDWCGPDDGGTCVDRTADPNNCGGCGARCTGTLSECFGGTCFLPLDAGAPDVPDLDSGRADAPRVDADERCPNPSYPTRCDVPGFGISCINVQTSNGMTPARHCGACNTACPTAAPECVAGRCTAASTDAGAPPLDSARMCPPSAPAMCLEGRCWNLQTSNGIVPAVNCGACGNACPTAAPECVGGRCTTLAPDAGR